MSHRKRIETSREARLWIGQVFTPIVGAVLVASPEARKKAVELFDSSKATLKTKFKKSE